MQNKPVVSVIIPVYNVEKYLPRCLDSVLNQTFSDWEAICVNDGSPDNSAKILATYARRDSRFRVIDKENGGLSDARNVGVAAARGDFVLFLDSDDFIHPQTLEITHNMAICHGADMVSFKYNEKSHRRLRRLMQRGIDVSDVIPDEFSRHYDGRNISGCVTDDILFHCTERNHTWRVCRPVRRHCFPVLCLYRRSLIADVPFIRGIIMEDFPWWSAIIARNPRTVILDSVLYFYTPNPTSILNSSKSLRMIESLCVGLEYAYNVYQNTPPDVQKYYAREFLWPFIITAMRVRGGLDGRSDILAARRAFKRLVGAGVCDAPQNRRARKYQKRIYAFIQGDK